MSEFDVEIRRALAAGYALALQEYGHALWTDGAVLAFAGSFAKQSDESVGRAYRAWCVQISERAGPNGATPMLPTQRQGVEQPAGPNPSVQ